MYGTKLEIVLPKAEPGHWNTLYVPKKAAATEVPTSVEDTKNEKDSETDSDTDLNDIEQVRGVRITDA